MTCKYNGWIRPTKYQGMYNFITRSIESELIPACRRYGMDIVVYNPIAGGLFSRQVRTKDTIPQEGRFSNVHRNGWQSRGRYFRDSTFAAIDLADETLGKFRLNMIEASLRWLMHHSALRVKSGNDGIILGVSKVEHLRENLSYLESGPLPDEVVKALNAAWTMTKAETANYWHLDLKYTYDTEQELFEEGKK
jgi:aflatoxin B1 aldehyde reductase